MNRSKTIERGIAVQDEDRLMTQEEVAEYLSISPANLERWRCYGGGPPYIKIGRLVRYRYSDLRAYIESLRGLVQYKGKVL